MHEGHFPGRERDEGEVLGYYAALDYVEEPSLNDPLDGDYVDDVG